MMEPKTFNRIIYFVVFLLIVFGFSFGYIYTTGRNNNQAAKDYISYEDTNTLQGETDTAKNVINQDSIKDAKFTKKTLYKVCGHTIESSSDLPKEIKDFTIEQFKNSYKDWTIEKFSPDEVIISKETNSKCPNHYIVKEKNGKVAVTYQTPVGGTSIKEITNIEISSLSKADQDRLRQGIIVNSNEKLAELLEDLGS